MLPDSNTLPEGEENEDGKENTAMKKRGTRVTVGIMALVATLMMATAVLGAPQRGPGRHGPPQEAIEACEGMSAGDTVEFETPRGDTISGICREIRGQLVAVPEGGPPDGERGPGRRGNDD